MVWRSGRSFHEKARRTVVCFIAGTVVLVGSLTDTIRAENNGVAAKPQMGWSSWSFVRKKPNEELIKAQAFGLHSILQSHGFEYVNLDDFWYLDPRTTVDEYGRWVHDPVKFPHGMASLATYIHSLGLKFGMYVTPGLPVAAYKQNTPIEGTQYHARDIADTSRFETNYNYGLDAMYYIDYSKAGAQQFINSWARLFASWGVDYIKIDGVGTADIADVKAWSEALNLAGRSIHLALSNSLKESHGATWREYANSWRISGDVEAYLGKSSYPLTDWTKVLSHFQLASQWTHFAGPGGWNDLDSLEIGNGSEDGTNRGTSSANFFTESERRSLVTYWCMAASPLLLGTDLTAKLDRYDFGLLGNDEVIAIDQAGVPGAPIVDYLYEDPNGATPEVWRSRQPDGTYALVLTNPSATPRNGTADWTIFGVTGKVIVRDLWSRSDLVASPNVNGGYRFSSRITFSLDAHQSKFLKISPLSPISQYLADAKVNRLMEPTRLASKNTATDGLAASYVGNGGSITFENVYAPKAGRYNVGFLYFNGDRSRVATISVNSGAAITVTFPGTGSFTSLGTLTQRLNLNQGDNTIAISAPSNRYAPDIDSIVVVAQATQYFADAARLNGQAIKTIACRNCSDGKRVTGIGKDNTLVFTNVRATRAGNHNVTILYLTGVTLSAGIEANSGTWRQIEFQSTSSNASDSTIVGAANLELSLREGDNTITISKENGSAPDIDSIIVAD